jgi:hypothetical protein
MIYDHSLFWRTRRAISAGGFLITIHNIIDVAAARAYLVGGVREGRGIGKALTAWIFHLPCEYILCMIIPEIDLSCPSNWNSSSLSVPSFQ